VETTGKIEENSLAEFQNPKVASRPTVYRCLKMEDAQRKSKQRPPMTFTAYCWTYRTG
jgi:hypothetical protein